MATDGNWARVFINGREVTSDSTDINHAFLFKRNKVMAQNVGVQQTSLGVFAPTKQLAGYTRRGMGVQSAHNLLSPSGPGNPLDVNWLVCTLIGHQTSPGVGDAAILFDGTRGDYLRSDSISGSDTVQKYSTDFKNRGKLTPSFPFLHYDNPAFKTATNIASTPFDDGAEGAASGNYGGLGWVDVYSPTGVFATGNISLSGQPSDGDQFTLTIGGVAYVYTFKTALTPTAGQVLIGATVAATATNLFMAMTGSQGAFTPAGVGVNYAAGTVAIPQNLLTGLVTVAVPNSSNQINLTALATGVAANAYTLVATVNVSTNLHVSAGTMTGGVAGDTYNVTLACATTSGGSYTTIATLNGIGPAYGAFRLDVPIGTVIQEWLKWTITLASGSGTVQTMGVHTLFGRFWGV